MSLVQLRALCIESPNLNSNYTLQNYLKTHGFEEKASEVDAFFNRSIGGKITLREVIKVTTDKFIAHYDTITIGNNSDLDYEYEAERSFYRFLCEKDLSRKESGISLYSILDFMEQMVNDVEVNGDIKNNSIAWSTWL